MSFDPDKLIMMLRGLPAAQCYWIGYSGGLDSSVLLHALVQRRHALGAELRAVHVNHHVNSRSNDWQAHCTRVCAKLQIPLECRSVEVKPAKGESLEAVARELRYTVYRELMRADDMLLLAHHQDDQMETFLLQALRGAGLRGLAGMPAIANLGVGKLARPLLGYPHAELHAWANAQELDWLDDPSNADARFDRNYLRQHVIPLIRERWPSAAQTMSRSARHCGEALELLAGAAAEDWVTCVDQQNATLAVSALQTLEVRRAKNLLRYWLEKLDIPLPPAHKLEQIMHDVLPAGADRNPCVSWEGAELRRYRGRLYALTPLPEPPAGEFQLQRGEPVKLDSGLGILQLVAATGEGLRASVYPAAGFKVSFRSGGELCQPAGHAHRRPLKKWLQELGVLPWMRERLPLIYLGDQLAAVAGLFVCAPFAASTGEPGLRIEWLPHPRLQ
ncbi:MAG: tRNA lysidine(34) synthetase TilS [Gammaproteobacteria bacterium]